MPAARNPAIFLRKEPQQQRSRQLVAAVLEAAVRILRSEGAHAFTMARIAERAGVSVGSLYQYFPNKQAVLYRLQTAEWRQTGERMAALLSDRRRRPAQRLAAMILAFFESECEEAAFRHALAEALPRYRRSPDALAQRRRSRKIMNDFIADALPGAATAARAFAADFVMTTIGALGARLSDESMAPREIETYAAATAAMLNAWLKRAAVTTALTAR